MHARLRLDSSRLTSWHPGTPVPSSSSISSAFASVMSLRIVICMHDMRRARRKLDLQCMLEMVLEHQCAYRQILELVRVRPGPLHGRQPHVMQALRNRASVRVVRRVRRQLGHDLCVLHMTCSLGSGRLHGSGHSTHRSADRLAGRGCLDKCIVVCALCWTSLGM